MKKFTRRCLSVILAAAMFFSVCPQNAFSVIAETAQSVATEAVDTFDVDFADLAALVDSAQYDENGLYQSTAQDTAINEWINARFGVFVNREAARYQQKEFLGQGSFSVVGFEALTSSAFNDNWGGEINLKIHQSGSLHHTSTKVGDQQIRKSHTLTVKNQYGDYAELANFEAEIVFNKSGSNSLGSVYVSFHEQTPGKVLRHNSTFLGISGNEAVILGSVLSGTSVVADGIIVGDVANTNTKTGYTSFGETLDNSADYKLTVKVVGTELTATVTKVSDGTVIYTGTSVIAAGSGSLSVGLGNSARSLKSVKVTELDEDGNPVDFGQKRTLQDFSWSLTNKGWYGNSKYWTDSTTSVGTLYYNFVNTSSGVLENTETAKAIVAALNKQFDNVYNREGSVKDSEFGKKVSYEGQTNNYAYFRTAYLNKWLQFTVTSAGGNEIMRHISSLVPKGHDGKQFYFQNFETTFQVRLTTVNSDPFYAASVAFGFRQQEAGKYTTGWYGMNQQQGLVAFTSHGYNFAGGTDIIGARTTAANAAEDMYGKVQNAFATSIASDAVVEVYVKAVGDQVTLKITKKGTAGTGDTVLVEETRTIPYIEPGYIAYGMGNKGSDIGNITLTHLDENGDKISLYEQTETERAAKNSANATHREIDFNNIPGAEYASSKYTAVNTNWVHFSRLDASVLEEVLGDVKMVFNDGATYTTRSVFLSGKGTWLLFYNRWLQLSGSPTTVATRIGNINALVPLDEGGAARKLADSSVKFDFNIENTTNIILVGLRQDVPGLFMTDDGELNKNQVLVAITKNSVRVAGGDDIRFEDFALGYTEVDDDNDPATAMVKVWDEYADDEFGDVFASPLQTANSSTAISVEVRAVGRTIEIIIYNSYGTMLYRGGFTTDYVESGYTAIAVSNSSRANFGAITLSNLLPAGYYTDYPTCDGGHVYDNACANICNKCGGDRLKGHTYDNTCDTQCNVCGANRETTHAFDNDCDGICNVCGETRDVSHIYDDLSDVECNVCGAVSTVGTTGDCYWRLEGTVLTISGNGAMEDYRWTSAPWGKNITEVIIQDGVTTIGDWAFGNCGVLTMVTIPDSVTAIGNYAFDFCRALTEVTIGSGVTAISNTAFSYCSALISISVDADNEHYCDIDGVLFNKDAKTLIRYPQGKDGAYVIPDGVTAIGDRAFEDCCLLTSVTIPDSVTTIGRSAFYWCAALAEVTIGSGVTTIGDSAFYDCSALVSISVDADNGYYCDIDGVLFSKDAKTLIRYPQGKDGAYVIPDGVTAIGDRAFEDCYLLTLVTIPDGVTSIGDSAFSDCDALTEATIPDRVITIGNSVFSACDALTEVTIGSGATTIGYDALSHCRALTSISVDADNACYCDIDGVLFSKDVKTLVRYPSQKDGTAYVIPDSVTTIGNDAFSDCDALTEVTIPDSVTTIGSSAFSNCEALIEVIIPNGVTAIGYGTFVWCDALTTVTIPNSVTTIGDQAFDYCPALTDVYYVGTEEKAAQISIGSTNTGLLNALWHYSCANGHIYDNACDVDCNVCGEVREVEPHVYDNACDTDCNVCGENREITHTFDNDCDGICNVCGETRDASHIYDDLSDVECNVCGAVSTTGTTGACYWRLEGTVLTIGGNGAMEDYRWTSAPWGKNITEVIIENGVTSIGTVAFVGCSALTEVTIPDSVITIGNSAFSGCSALIDVYYSGTVAGKAAISIGDNSDLLSAVWHCIDSCENEHTYDGAMDADCNVCGLERIVGTAGDCYWRLEGAALIISGNGAMGDYPHDAPWTFLAGKIKTIIIEEGVTAIGEYAFRGCSALTEITIPDSVTAIGRGAFNDSRALAKVHIADIGAWCNIRFGGSWMEGDVGNPFYSSSAELYLNGELLTDVVIPQGVTTIHQLAFSYASLRSVSIPDSVTTISYSAFSGTALTEAIIPNSVTIIGEWAFCGCKALETVTIGNNVTTIGQSVFSGCSALTDVYYVGTEEQATKMSIGDYNEELLNATWHYSCANGHTYDDACDTDCNMCSEVRQPPHDYVWVVDTAETCGVDGVKHEECTVCHVVRNENTAISATGNHDYVWVVDKEETCSEDGAKHEECTVCHTTRNENTVISATGDHEYDNACDVECNVCGEVREVEPHVYDHACDTDCNVCGETRDVLHIYDDFSDAECNECGAESTVGITGACYWRLEGTVLTISGNGAMGDGIGPWGTDITKVIIEDGVTTIGNSAFYDCLSLTSVEIPDSVTTIGDHAFEECAGLTVTIPDSVTTIGNGAFVCCGFTSVVIPDSVTYVGATAFYRCHGLVSVTFGKGVTSIKSGTFAACESLTTVTLPASVTTIGDSAFESLVLTDVYYLGTKEQAAQMSVGNNEYLLSRATWHYFCENGHTYDNTCDTDCNVCGGTREIEHTPVVVTDLEATCGTPGMMHVECMVCQQKMGEYTAIPATGNHIFSNNCDAACDTEGCSYTRIPADHVYDNARDAECNVCGEVRELNQTGNCYWQVVDGVLTICGNGEMGDIDLYAPWGYDITTVIVEEGITSLSDAVFADCYALTSVTLPSTLTDIGQYAFSNCGALTEIHIPSSVTFIGCFAFIGCDALDSVYITDMDAWNAITFDGFGANPLEKAQNLYVNGELHIHTFEWIVDEEETCVDDGRQHEECTVCHITRNEETVIPAREHEYDNDCDTDCNVCGDAREIEHDYVWIVDKAENCGVDGVKHEECTVCGAVRNENTVISATNAHSYDNACDAECNVCAQVREVQPHAYSNACDATCNICGAVREIVHTFKWVVDKAETCGVNGEKHEKCIVCHVTRNENTVIPATGNHTYDNACDTDCNVCGDAREIEHDYVWIVDKAENCGVDGVKHEECTVCDAVRNENTVIPATNAHNYDNACDAECNVCTQVREVQPHVYDNACDTDCNVCGDAREIEHDYVWIVDKAENCGVDGVKHEECTVCDAVRNENTVISATGNHTYNTICDTDCIVCGQFRNVDGCPGEDTPHATFVVDTAKGKAGDVVKVAVRVERNAGIASFRVNIAFDDAVLELLSFEQGDFNGLFSTSPLDKNPAVATWVATEEVTSDGVIGYLTFRIKEDAVLGESALEITYDSNDVYDQDFNEVHFATQNGSVEVVTYISGDLDRNGMVNNVDLGLLLRYVSDWDVEIDELAADVNRDGNVDNQDLGILLRYVSGWDVVLK